ncbi:helix-turn-helix domain-containing protein [Acidovorax sp. LjRoot74]|uniref:helix-turn-helix domain-containing protein n=1 Tax=Acidovorax sp. LjRoot74 TaxID=3342337 RepID=UPI003ECF19C4
MNTNPSIRSIAGYAELPLGTLDAEKIEAVWCYTPLAEGRQLVLPDGRMDLVVHCVVMPQGIAKPVLLVIAGPTQTPTVVALRPQTVILGVRFHIGWGGACLGIAPSAVRNRTVVGSEVERCLGFLAREILVQNTLLGVESALRSVAGALASRARAAPAHGRVLHVLDCMQRGTEGEGVATSWGPPSARTLRRDMMAVVGLPLRTLAGILRFQRAMALLVTGTASIGEVAIAAGYADQSHMTREFRRFGGFTPAVPTPAPLVRLAPSPA